MLRGSLLHTHPLCSMSHMGGSYDDEIVRVLLQRN